MSLSSTGIDIILKLITRNCLSTRTFNGTGKVIRWVKLHKLSSCKGVGQILLSQWYFSMIQPQGRHAAKNWGSISHLSALHTSNELLPLAVNPSELLLLITVTQFLQVAFNSERPWCNGESSFSLCK